jgi:putative ABC transport system permease protein
MRLLRRLWFVLTRQRQEDELADELEFHRQMKADELRAKGIAEHEIRAATQRALGNDLLARERARDIWVAPWFQDVTQDVRLALRTLGRDRRFALSAIVTLALGMAVTNTAFHFVNAAMFRDVPFENPSRLITIRTDDPRGFVSGVSYPEYLQWRDHTTAFETLTAHANQSVNLSDDDNGADRVSGHFVTHESFRMVRTSPVLGRDFVAEDDRDGAAPVMILGHATWRNRYGADPAVVGRTVRVSGEPTTIIGVMPEGFQYPLIADVWLPMSRLPGLRNATWRSTGFGAVGRLKDGVTMEQARSEVDTIAAATLREHPEVSKERKVTVMGLKDSQLAKDGKQLLWAFLGASVVVLLLASANVANLLLARTWQRSREIAVRAALGASRWRIVRQSLIECLLIGGGGGLLGAYLSFAGFRMMSSAFNIYEAGAFDRPRKPYWFEASPDEFGWMFMGAAFLFGSLAAGLIPAVHLSRVNAGQVLAGGRDGHAARTSRRWTNALMAAQIAIALMMLSAGGLFARNFIQMYRTDPVMAADGLVSMQLTLTARYGSPEERLQFARRLDERLQTTPEFSGAAIGNVPLQLAPQLSRTVRLDGELPDPSRPPRTAVYIAAGPRYFELLKLPLIKGRALADGDELRGREAAVINQRFSALFFGDADPLGKRIQLSAPGPASDPLPAFVTIVGVIPTIPDFNVSRPDDAMVIAPLFGDPTPSRALSVIVRSDAKAAAAAALRRQVAAIDNDLPIYSIQTVQEQLAMTRMAPRMVGAWFQTLAAIALLLSAVGLYALTAQGVSQRRREIGVRMTLGARGRQVLSMFVQQTARIVAIGIVAGVLAALSVNRLLVSFLGAVSPSDPLTFGIVTLLLVAVSLIAALVPARKATLVDPVEVLRAD